MKQRTRKRLLFVTSLLVVLCILMAACSAPHSQSGAAKTSNQAETEVSHDSAAPGSSHANSAPAQPTAENPSVPSSGVMSSPAISSRKMIYKANVQAEVENFAKARSSLTSLVTRFQGYILSSSEYESDQEKGGDIVVRIPQAGFSSFLEELDKLATKIPVRSIEGQDVTEEYVDLSSRLKARQAVEARLLQFMADAKKTENLLKISSDLAGVQEEIERIKGRMRYLDKNVAYSTISLVLVEKKVIAKLDDVTDASTWEHAWLSFHQSLLAILSFLKWLIVFIAGSIPVVLFLAIPGIPVILFWMRLRKRNQTPPPPPSIDETP
ncbi:DUF4349 domain-containing protein [Brevibacillus sp. H7]|uniref:DUF4349 domain-containing protein n=1 Tax=Brevibacillus sp. H7 TaxID=3349138 RepID=UPI0037F451B6